MNADNKQNPGTRTMLTRNASRNWLALVAVAALAIGLALPAWAQNQVTDVSHDMSSDGVAITITAAEGAPEATVFSTENPPRIVVDLEGVDSDVSSQPVSVGAGGVQQYAAVGAGGRTRVIVDLSKTLDYDLQSSGNAVTLNVMGGGSASSTMASSGGSAAMASGSGDYAIQGIDFRRGGSGEGQVIIDLSRAGANVSVDDRGNQLTVDFFNTDISDGLRQNLDVTDFATPVRFISTNSRGDGVRMELTMSGEYEYSSFQNGPEYTIEVAEPVVDQAEPEPEVSFFEDRAYEGRAVSFNFQDIPVRSVLALIADAADLNIVVADSVDGNITLRLTNVPWDQALDIVLDSKNLDSRRNGNIIWVAPTEEIAQREQQLLAAQRDRKQLEPLRTVLIDLSYAKAAEIQALIEEGSQNVGGGSGANQDAGLLSDRGSVTIDERTNTLLVTDTPDRIEGIRELVTQLDRSVRQVQIASRIVIANDDFSKELGVRFGVTHSHLGSNAFGISGNTDGATIANPIIETDEGFDVFPDFNNNRYNVDLPVADPAGSFGLSFITGNYFLDLELSALEADGRGETLSEPRVVTANQAEAFIQQGVEIPFQQATSSGATAVEFKDAVLELRVTPLITPDDRVQLDLNVKQDTRGEIFVGQNGAQIPAIDTRELGTTVLVNDGETVVLGGIFQDQRNYQEDKVPLLGDIPALGHLFKRRATSNQKRELLIFVTPTILNSDAP